MSFGRIKIGKIGRANIQANKKLKELFLDKGTRYCEMRFDGCLINWALQYCHRHLRNWYNGDIDKLSDYKQAILGCQNCHSILHSKPKEFTEQVFKKLRGDEN